MIARIAALAAILIPAAVFAHTPESSLTGGFAQGLAHVLDGADHVLALVALGLWGAWLGGRRNKARPFALAAAAILAAFALVHGWGGAEPLFVAGMTAAGGLLLASSVAAARAAEKIGHPRAQAVARAGAVVVAGLGLILLVA
ncbi:MAG: hypothetical protein FJX42_05080 [Alphaproteobacteria bacterium]|nr:hypothetical protein [Alphaproteobacteria bacterium]